MLSNMTENKRYTSTKKETIESTHCLTSAFVAVPFESIVTDASCAARHVHAASILTTTSVVVQTLVIICNKDFIILTKTTITSVITKIITTVIDTAIIISATKYHHVANMNIITTTKIIKC